MRLYLVKNKKYQQFSLRTLFVCMTVLGLAVGWIAYQRREIKKQQLAIRILEERGALLDWESEYKPGVITKFLFGNAAPVRILRADFTDKNLTDDDLVHLKTFNDVQQLCLCTSVEPRSSRISDDAMVHVRQLSSLRSLDLAFTPITDKGLSMIAAMSQLRKLYLDATQITDAGLMKIRKMQLTHLSLMDTSISDAGISHLTHLKSLEYLNLAGTQITEAGLSQLVVIRSLKKVDVTGTSISGACIESLRKQRSDLVFEDRFKVK